jgi:hypothetical protein
MTTTRESLPAPAPSEAPTRPSALRRVAVGAAGFVACALPTVWGISTVGELVTGAERDHLFHQLTGQGLLLSALWLGPLIPLIAAGWRGRRPSAAAGVASVAVPVAAGLAAVLAPGNGGAVVAGIAAVTVALLWTAIPRRPRSGGMDVDPVLAPLALLTAALYVPFVVGQGALQRHSGDEHAAFSHYFDMAWVGGILVVLAVAAAIVPAARRLVLIAMAGTVLIGAARYLITPEVTWSLLATSLGLVGLAAGGLRLARRAG